MTVETWEGDIRAWAEASFDVWTPNGPGIVFSRIIEDLQALNLSTKSEWKGDAKEMQRSSTGDQAFSIVQTIVFSSKGTTLVPSDLIFTGTPEGLGMGRTTPPSGYGAVTSSRSA